MRRRPLLVIGALAFAGAAVASGASAQTEPPVPGSTSTTVRPTTTTSPPMTVGPTTTSPPTTAKPSSTTTTARGATTSTSVSRAPVPPPASGASQPLDPSLLGGLPGVAPNPSTTIPAFLTESELSTTTTTVVAEDSAISVSKSSNGPSGTTLALASLAWLASLGGVLIYAEEQRSRQWRHLAR